jgi:Sec-independent protein translocase protein TatA
MFQGPELVLIVIVALLIFGLGKWPAVSRRLAQLRLNFEKGVAEDAEVEGEDPARLEDGPERGGG